MQLGFTGVVSALVFLSACAHDLPPADQLALSFQSPTLALSSGQILEVDTEIALANGARFVAPRGWSLLNEGAAVIVTAPEPGSRIVIAEGGHASADAAVAAVWPKYHPGDPAAAVGAPRKAREGWDETLVYRFEAKPAHSQTVFALALRKGENWTVLINDLSDTVAERRDGQLEVIFNSLLPEGYARETFAGRTAHKLDDSRIAELSNLIELARQELDIPGVALGLIQDGKVVFQGGFGVRELGQAEPVTADTLFNVASNGKPWTTLMLAKLVEAGQLDWNAPAATILPQFRVGDPETTRNIQVRHLVCACTGMPRQDYDWLFDGETQSAQLILDLLSTARPTSAFGDTYQYSNLMAAAAGFLGGHILHPELELGAAYDAAVQELVFDPLGMSATVPVEDIALTGNYAAGHSLDVDGNLRVASQGLNLMAIPTRPSGNHWSNVRDMLRYVSMELEGGQLAGGERYIRESLLRERRLPQVTSGLNEYYGMGLKIDEQWGVTVIHHGGTTAGYKTDMIWLPDHGVGAVILINSDTGSVLRAAFRRRLLEILFDGVPTAVPDLKSFAPNLRADITESRPSLTVPAAPEHAARLAGTYLSTELGSIDIRQVDGATWFDFGGWSSEVATRVDDGTVTFVTISPGTDGFEFAVAEDAGPRRLKIADADRTYIFSEVYPD